MTRLAPDVRTGDMLYSAVQQLSPHDDEQRGLKGQASAAVLELAQLRILLMTQATPAISQPLLVIVISWLVVIFLGFSVVSPTNSTTGIALLVAALAVTGAVFLILELDRPFDGLLSVSGEPFFNIIAGFTK